MRVLYNDEVQKINLFTQNTYFNDLAVYPFSTNSIVGFSNMASYATERYFLKPFVYVVEKEISYVLLR